MIKKLIRSDKDLNEVVETLKPTGKQMIMVKNDANPDFFLGLFYSHEQNQWVFNNFCHIKSADEIFNLGELSFYLMDDIETIIYHIQNRIINRHLVATEASSLNNLISDLHKDKYKLIEIQDENNEIGLLVGCCEMLEFNTYGYVYMTLDGNLHYALSTTPYHLFTEYDDEMQSKFDKIMDERDFEDMLLNKIALHFSCSDMIFVQI